MAAVATFLLVGHQPWAAKMVASVKDVLKLPVIQLSDESTAEVTGVDEVVRRRKTVDLMPYRLEHLANCPYDEWVTFDTDIIVKKPVDDVWDRKFDVALTKRTEAVCTSPEGHDIAQIMPFNTGVMFSRVPAFWTEAHAWLLKQDKKAQEWWGDQLAVAQIAHAIRYHVLVLPGHIFNWSPDRADEESPARIWHYKGSNRKAWM